MQFNSRPNGGPHDDWDTDDPLLLEAFNQLAERCRAGEPVDESTLKRDYPQYAESLEESLPALHLLAALGAPARAGDSTPTPDPLLEGLLPDFEDLQAIGQGGMGIVYKARQISLERTVALKFLPHTAALADRRRFLREARAAASLDHEHIVPILEVEVTGPKPYYAMKYIAGHSLAEVLQGLRRQMRGGGDEPARIGELPGSLVGLMEQLCTDGFDPDNPKRNPPNPAREAGAKATARIGRPYANAVARLGLQAALALQHAHEGGVIHRDVKPSNLLLDCGGRLWLTDFGLVLLKDQEATLACVAGGTLGYMSPEQLSHEDQLSSTKLPIDHRTDVYSLGVTLYELLTLRRLHPERARAEAQRDEPPLPRRLNPAVPRDLETIVLKAMEPEAPRRYGTAGELAEDLKRFLKEEPIRARRPTLADRLGKWTRRHRRGVVASSLAGGVILVAVIGTLVVSNHRVRRALEAEAHQRSRAGTSLEIMRNLMRNTTLAAEHLTESVPLGSDRLHAYYTEMLGFYEQSLERIPDAHTDPELLFRTALANYHLARSYDSRERR